MLARAGSGPGHGPGMGRDGVGDVFASLSQGTDGGGAKARAQGTPRDIGGRGVRQDAQEEGTKKKWKRVKELKWSERREGRRVKEKGEQE